MYRVYGLCPIFCKTLCQRASSSPLLRLLFKRHSKAPKTRTFLKLKQAPGKPVNLLAMNFTFLELVCVCNVCTGAAMQCFRLSDHHRISFPAGGVQCLDVFRDCGCQGLPRVSIVVPFWGLPCRIPHIKMVKPQTGTTMETIGLLLQLNGTLKGVLKVTLGFRASGRSAMMQPCWLWLGCRLSIRELRRCSKAPNYLAPRVHVRKSYIL